MNSLATWPPQADLDEVEGDPEAVWLAESKGETDHPRPGIGSSSIAHETIEAFQEIGLLDEIVLTREGVVVYPVEMGTKPG